MIVEPLSETENYLFSLFKNNHREDHILVALYKLKDLIDTCYIDDGIPLTYDTIPMDFLVYHLAKLLVVIEDFYDGATNSFYLSDREKSAANGFLNNHSHREVLN